MNHYTELTFKAEDDLQELLVAELSELNFDSFTQEENKLLAYTLTENYESQKTAIEAIIENYGVVLLQVRDIANDTNWNKEWEENFQPITIGDKIYVRALFHEPLEGFEHQIVIQPKMSFGTGHHETTQLMMELMLLLDFKEAACLDMGSGTGVLAILAEQLGAAYSIAIDYDPWCFENAQENFILNNTKNIKAMLGDSALLKDDEFLLPWQTKDKKIVLSNITRNYNLENISIYHNIMKPGNVMLLSGFYESDLEDLKNEAEKFQIKFVKSKVKNNWCAAQFIQQ